MKLPIPDKVLAQHVAILGKTRSGKSSVMRLLVEGLLERGEPVCIVDPKGDWYGIKLAADGKHPGFKVVIFGGEHADVPINAHAGKQVAELFATGNRPRLVDLGGWMPGDRTRFWIDFASTLFRFTKGNRWLAVDEIHNFAPKGKVFDVDAGKALHWTNRLASEGLGKGVAMLFASQRPQKVHNDTLTSAETLIAMRVLHPSDRGAVSDWIKGCGDSEGSEVLKSLAQMDRGEGWVWSPEIGYGPQRVKFPMFSTYDSFRPQSVEDTKKLKGWAEVDLDEVRAQFAESIEREKADDPRELRKRIAQLERELAEAKKLKPKIERIEIEQIQPTTVLKISGIAGDVRDAAEKLTVAANEITQAALRVFDVHRGEEDAPRRGRAVAGRPRREAEPTLPGARRDVPTGRRMDQVRAGPGRPNGNFDSGQRKVLTALAQYAGGRSKKQVAILTGYSGGGGRFNNILGSLRSGGYLEGNDTLRITDLGLVELGAWDPLPTGAALLDHWRSKLGGGETRVLNVIAASFPGTISKSACAAASGYEEGGGRFNNILGYLRTLELIEGRGELRASEELFS